MFKSIRRKTVLGSGSIDVNNSSDEHLEYSACPAGGRVSPDDDYDLSMHIIRQHQRAIASGEYPEKLIRHNFIQGGNDLPDVDKIDHELYKKLNIHDRKVILKNYLYAMSKLPPYRANKTLYRGTMVDKSFFASLHCGNYLQSHQLSFFSESELVSHSFIDNSGGERIPVLYVMKKPPENIFKEGVLDVNLYSKLKSDLQKMGVKESKLKGIGSAESYKEVILPPGIVFSVVKISSTKTKIHQNKINVVEIVYKLKTDKIVNSPLY